ncbi:hypothetical protein LZ32DRAFT_153734 [Colletotrichum eremochloae]|nr:hypothetical protein LZ32DRAFT_153734 [Colletotrichum eremochloae]
MTTRLLCAIPHISISQRGSVEVIICCSVNLCAFFSISVSISMSRATLKLHLVPDPVPFVTCQAAIYCYKKSKNHDLPSSKGFLRTLVRPKGTKRSGADPWRAARLSASTQRWQHQDPGHSRYGSPLLSLAGSKAIGEIAVP